ncbi:MAG: PilZ domain-containing protein [Desulfobacterales bacterium]|nr:MAG: PilZ domain-containing protein [Desulfobacterales bacterium]
MNYRERRNYERAQLEALVQCTIFNAAKSFPAKTFNHGMGGMYLRSKTLLQPGIALCIRLKDFPTYKDCPGFCQGLRTMTLAEVKWCRELSDADAFGYEFGVRYYEPDY